MSDELGIGFELTSNYKLGYKIRLETELTTFWRDSWPWNKPVMTNHEKNIVYKSQKNDSKILLHNYFENGFSTFGYCVIKLGQCVLLIPCRYYVIS